MKKENYGGYDPSIFIKPVNQDFMCTICNSNDLLAKKKIIHN